MKILPIYNTSIFTIFIQFCPQIVISTKQYHIAIEKDL